MAVLNAAPAARLLATCRALGVHLEPLDGRLRVVAPRGTVGPELRDELAAHRDALLDLLDHEHDLPPAAALDAAWRRAVARAREGYAAAGGEPSPADLEGAALLELAADPQAPAPEDAPTRELARRFLPAVREGRLVARVSAAGRPVVAQAAGALDLRHRAPRPGPAEETRPRCAGCRERFPGAPGGLCGCCDLGASKLPPSRAMPYLLALREERGPAGRRGVRDAEMRQWLRRERAERREVESDQTDWLEEAEPQGSA